MNQSPHHQQQQQQQVNDVKEGKKKNKEEESKVAAAQEVEDEEEEDEDKEIGLPPVLRMALEHILRFGDHNVWIFFPIPHSPLPYICVFKLN